MSCTLAGRANVHDVGTAVCPEAPQPSHKLKTPAVPRGSGRRLAGRSRRAGVPRLVDRWIDTTAVTAIIAATATSPGENARRGLWPTWLPDGVAARRRGPRHDDRVPAPPSGPRSGFLVGDPEIARPGQRSQWRSIGVRLRELEPCRVSGLLGITDMQTDDVRHLNDVRQSPWVTRHDRPPQLSVSVRSARPPTHGQRRARMEPLERERGGSKFWLVVISGCSGGGRETPPIQSSVARCQCCRRSASASEQTSC